MQNPSRSMPGCKTMTIRILSSIFDLRMIVMHDFSFYCTFMFFHLSGVRAANAMV